MEAGDFKDFAKAMTDYIAEYLENIRDRYVLLLIQAGKKVKTKYELPLNTKFWPRT